MLRGLHSIVLPRSDSSSAGASAIAGPGLAMPTCVVSGRDFLGGLHGLFYETSITLHGSKLLLASEEGNPVQVFTIALL